MKYDNPNTLKKLYHQKDMSMNEIAETLGCSISTIHKYMEKYDIERQTPNQKKPPEFILDNNGYEYWRTHTDGRQRWISIHRLLAVSKFGFEKIKDMEVHHINDIPWDNRPENLDLMTEKNHGRHSAEKRWNNNSLRAP